MKDGVIGHGWRMQAMTSRASIVASRIHREQQPLNMVHENHPLFGDPAIDPSKTCSSACRYEDADKRHFALLFSSTRGVWPTEGGVSAGGELLEDIATHPRQLCG
jgi:hypothetical protein